jgi:Protein of unknown function (DUF2510)
VASCSNDRVSGTPAGWYPDPEDAAQQRYWDGAQWTEHVAPATAPEAGWHPDPSARGQLRYWDGRAWTDHVQEVPLFDGMVPLVTFGRKKEQHLLVTTEEVVWGDERIRWSDVTWFSQLITVQNGVETVYEIWLDRGDVQSRLIFARGTKSNRLPRLAYDTIIDQLGATLGARIVEGLLGMVADGEPVRTAGLVFSPEGFGLEAKGDLVPWTEYAGIEIFGHEGIYVQLFRQHGDKRKKVVRVKVDQLRAWAIPPVVEAHARRYGGGP